jgi:FxLD family lantipeptide
MSMAPQTAVLDAPTAPDAEVVTDDDFELDMRVVEATTPLTIFMCNTNDGCGSTCSTSACSTSSYDPR